MWYHLPAPTPGSQWVSEWVQTCCRPWPALIIILGLCWDFGPLLLIIKTFLSPFVHLWGYPSGNVSFLLHLFATFMMLFGAALQISSSAGTISFSRRKLTEDHLSDSSQTNALIITGIVSSKKDGGGNFEKRCWKKGSTFLLWQRRGNTCELIYYLSVASRNVEKDKISPIITSDVIGLANAAVVRPY